MIKSILCQVSKLLSCMALCAVAALSTGCADHVSDKDIEAVTINLPQTRSFLQDKPGVALAIDTRTPADFSAAHIPGARNLDLSAVSAIPESIDPDLAAFNTLVVYGADPGSNSARAMTKRLIRAGHKDVKYFPGGMAEWLAAGMRTEGSGPVRITRPAPAAVR
jgi:rhodanese-related sulfurtransferase